MKWNCICASIARGARVYVCAPAEDITRRIFLLELDFAQQQQRLAHSSSSENIRRRRSRDNQCETKQKTKQKNEYIDAHTHNIQSQEMRRMLLDELLDPAHPVLRCGWPIVSSRDCWRFRSTFPVSAWQIALSLSLSLTSPLARPIYAPLSALSRVRQTLGESSGEAPRRRYTIHFHTQICLGQEKCYST